MGENYYLCPLCYDWPYIITYHSITKLTRDPKSLIFLEFSSYTFIFMSNDDYVNDQHFVEPKFNHVEVNLMKIMS